MGDIFTIGFFMGLLLGLFYGGAIVDCLLSPTVRRLRKELAETREALHWYHNNSSICCDCGEPTQEVRPGKVQCNNPWCPSNAIDMGEDEMPDHA